MVCRCRSTFSASEKRSIGQVDWVPAAQLETHLAKMRRQGFADYRISPEGTRDAYAPITRYSKRSAHYLPDFLNSLNS